MTEQGLTVVYEGVLLLVVQVLKLIYVILAFRLPFSDVDIRQNFLDNSNLSKWKNRKTIIIVSTKYFVNRSFCCHVEVNPQLSLGHWYRDDQEECAWGSHAAAVGTSPGVNEGYQGSSRGPVFCWRATPSSAAGSPAPAGPASFGQVEL